MIVTDSPASNFVQDQQSVVEHFGALVLPDCGLWKKSLTDEAELAVASCDDCWLDPSAPGGIGVAGEDTATGGIAMPEPKKPMARRGRNPLCFPALCLSVCLCLPVLPKRGTRDVTRDSRSWPATPVLVPDDCVQVSLNLSVESGSE
jgi:hypothetical protein